MLGERVAFAPQVASLFHSTTELPLMPPGKPPVLGGVCREPLDIGDKLLISLPGFRKRGFRAPLRISRLLGLQHHALLDALEPGRRPINLCPQRRFMFGVGGA
ncbi:hypothetical protein R69919_01052 [Paraburkholderia gardini]|nr:hypothetical protein R69919_01052 [Paraburkholderia gardini]